MMVFYTTHTRHTHTHSSLPSPDVLCTDVHSALRRAIDATASSEACGACVGAWACGGTQIKAAESETYNCTQHTYTIQRTPRTRHTQYYGDYAYDTLK